jgi:hypothetical protein
MRDRRQSCHGPIRAGPAALSAGLAGPRGPPVTAGVGENAGSHPPLQAWAPTAIEPCEARLSPVPG